MLVLPVYSIDNVVRVGITDNKFQNVLKQQTVIYGTDFEKEITILVIHGLLHLCGYDHVTDELAAIMEPLEDDLLAQWEATRA